MLNQRMPTFLSQPRGTVTMNSTVPTAAPAASNQPPRKRSLREYKDDDQVFVFNKAHEVNGNDGNKMQKGEVVLSIQTPEGPIVGVSVPRTDFPFELTGLVDASSIKKSTAVIQAVNNGLLTLADTDEAIRLLNSPAGLAEQERWRLLARGVESAATPVRAEDGARPVDMGSTSGPRVKLILDTSEAMKAGTMSVPEGVTTFKTLLTLLNETEQNELSGMQIHPALKNELNGFLNGVDPNAAPPQFKTPA